MQVNQQRLLNEFLELVRIDSFAGNERKIADRIIGKLTALDLEVNEDGAGKTISGNAGNIIAKLPGTEQKPTILFCAHMDRVSPGYGIKPIVENGIISSEGPTILAADDVAGIAAVLEAIRTIKDNDIPHGDIEIVFTIAEEGGLYGAKALDTSKLSADFGYFLDSNGPVGTIINQAPSHQNLDITFHGKTAHAGIEPEKGINAILVAATAISGMKIGRIDDETTANVGTIEGGVATNIVPDQCCIKCEVRSASPQKLSSQVEHMVDTAKKAAGKFDTDVDFDITDCYQAFFIPQSDEVVDLASKAASSIGLSPDVKKTGGGSDASIVNAKGIPSVVLGLNYKDVHTTKESMAVKDLVKATEYVVAIVEQS